MNNEKLVETIKEAQGGNVEAFDALYNESKKNVYYLGFKIFGNAEDAEDLTKDVFVSAFEKVNTLTETDNFSDLIKQITAEKLKDKLNKDGNLLFSSDSKVATQDEAFSNDMLPQDIAERTAISAAINKLVDELPYDQKACTLMFYYEHLGIPEIATLLDVDEDIVANILNFACKTVKEAVEEVKEKGFQLQSISAPMVIWSLYNNSTEVTASIPLTAKAILEASDIQTNGADFSNKAASDSEDFQSEVCNTVTTDNATADDTTVSDDTTTVSDDTTVSNDAIVADDVITSSDVLIDNNIPTSDNSSVVDSNKGQTEKLNDAPVADQTAVQAVAQPNVIPVFDPKTRQAAQPNGVPAFDPKTRQAAQPNGVPVFDPKTRQAAQSNGVPVFDPKTRQAAQPNNGPVFNPGANNAAQFTNGQTFNPSTYNNPSAPQNVFVPSTTAKSGGSAATIIGIIVALIVIILGVGAAMYFGVIPSPFAKHDKEPIASSQSNIVSSETTQQQEPVVEHESSTSNDIVSSSQPSQEQPQLPVYSQEETQSSTYTQSDPSTLNPYVGESMTSADTITFWRTLGGKWEHKLLDSQSNRITQVIEFSEFTRTGQTKVDTYYYYTDPLDTIISKCSLYSVVRLSSTSYCMYLDINDMAIGAHSEGGIGGLLPQAYCLLIETGPAGDGKVDITVYELHKKTEKAYEYWDYNKDDFTPFEFGYSMPEPNPVLSGAYNYVGKSSFY